MSKGTVLIFHGFGSNTKFAEAATPNIKKHLESEGFTVKYIQALIKLQPDDFPFEPRYDPSKNDLYGWWYIKNGSNRNLQSVEQVVQDRKFADDDTIVGVIGLSQGGSLTSLLSANRKRWIPSLKFGIGHGGFPYPTPSTDPESSAYDEKISIPYLTITGEKDERVKPEVSLRVANEFVAEGKSTSFTHPEGHIFADDEESVKQTIAFIRKALE